MRTPGCGRGRNLVCNGGEMPPVFPLVGISGCCPCLASIWLRSCFTVFKEITLRFTYCCCLLVICQLYLSHTVNQQILAAIKFGVCQNKVIWRLPVYAVYDQRNLRMLEPQILGKTRNSPNIIARKIC